MSRHGRSMMLCIRYTLPSSNEFTLAMLNILDNEAPLVANSLTTVNSALYDPRGRMWRLVL